MNIAILNREFKHPADGFYQIEAKGYHPNARSGVVQVIDDKAIRSCADNFNQAATAGALHHGNEMLVDHEHFKHDEKQETVAYAWMQEAKARPDGIYARNRWTATGKPAVDGGDYRFFSTEYDMETPGNYEEVAPSEIPADIRNKYTGMKFIRPLVLTGLTLTNQFNNRGQKPITNRETPLPGEPADSPTGEQVDIQNRKKQTMKAIAAKLGLSPDASEEAITGELTKLLNRATTAEAKATTLGEENTKLKNRITAFDTDQITGLFGEYKITDEKIINRLKPVLQPLANREERVAVLTDFGFKPGESKQETPAGGGRQIFNREGKPPVDKQNGAKQNATKIMNRAQELMKQTPGLTLATATVQAQSEIENG